MQAFLDFLIKPLLTAPDEFSVHLSGSTATLHVAVDDMGRVIGKHGIIISALRNLLRVYCVTHNQPVVTLTLAETTLKTE